jgi:hypothetical protein
LKDHPAAARLVRAAVLLAGAVAAVVPAAVALLQVVADLLRAAAVSAARHQSIATI